MDKNLFLEQATEIIDRKLDRVEELLERLKELPHAQKSLQKKYEKKFNQLTKILDEKKTK